MATKASGTLVLIIHVLEAACFMGPHVRIAPYLPWIFGFGERFDTSPTYPTHTLCTVLC